MHGDARPGGVEEGFGALFEGVARPRPHGGGRVREQPLRESLLERAAGLGPVQGAGASTARLAITLDGKVLALPYLTRPITDSKITINGPPTLFTRAYTWSAPAVPMSPSGRPGP
ncbi:hypothetical protein [Actinomadura geliboluensis]|uniref:hypothetical protein n=1 Tax=Actinomadura geliboluensis TaxID=882440 RepID=UPI003718C4EB